MFLYEKWLSFNSKFNLAPELGFTNDGFHYYESNTPLNYTEAEEFCANRDSSVVVIESQQEQIFLGNIAYADRLPW